VQQEFKTSNRNILSLLSKQTLLITIGIQSIGFTFFVIYYNNFNVPILYYLTLTDILLYTIMVLILFGTYLFLFRYLIIDSFANVLYKYNRELHSNSWTWVLIGISHIVFTWYYTQLVSELIYQLPINTLFFGILMSGTLVMDIGNNYEIPKNAEVVKDQNSDVSDPQEYINGRLAFIKVSLFVFGVVYMLITIDAGQVKNSDTTLTFSTSKKDYYVGYKSKQKLIGETSLYLFTYDTLTKISTAHNKTEIETIKFYPY